MLFLEQSAETLAISPWRATELHSGLGHKVRSGALSATEADRVLALEADDFGNANADLRGWSTSPGAAFALPLAIASGRGVTLCSLDAPFVLAAQQLGLAALLINQRPERNPALTRFRSLRQRSEQYRTSSQPSRWAATAPYKKPPLSRGF